MLRRLWGGLPAILFAAAFFAAPAVWALSREEAWVNVECGGAPWRCEVHRWRLFGTTRDSAAVERVFVRQVSHAGGGRVRARTNYQLVFDRGPAGTVTVTDEKAERAALDALVAQLDAARKQGAPVRAALEPEGSFWLIAGLAVLFACCGAAIPLMTLVGAGPGARTRR